MERHPLVSVGLPVYQGEKLLPRALDSLLAQTINDFEVIVCDNASTDATQSICEDYRARDERVKYFRNPTNIGLVGNFNRVFGLSSGEYFKWATHDDFFAPTFLARCLEQLEANRAAVLCSTGIEIVDGTGEVLETWTPMVDLRTQSGHVRFHRLMWSVDPLVIFGVMRKEAARQAMPLRSCLGFDRVFLAEMALVGPIEQIREPLHFYTRDADTRRGRVYSSYNDPVRAGRPPLRTWRLGFEHLKLALQSHLPWLLKAELAADVLARFGLRDARRLAAELYHSGRFLLDRGHAWIRGGGWHHERRQTNAGER